MKIHENQRITMTHVSDYETLLKRKFFLLQLFFYQTHLSKLEEYVVASGPSSILLF